MSAGDTPAPPARHLLALQPFTPELKHAANGWLFTLDPPEIIRGRLEVLAGYGPALRAGDVVLSDGRLGHTFPGPVSAGMMIRLYQTGWVDIDGPWGDALEQGALYAGINGPSELEPDAFENATPFHLHLRLTVIFRLDRFSFGTIERALESGVMLQIIERAEALLKSPS